MTWRETVRDSLIADFPYTEPGEMPSDGSKARTGMAILALSASLTVAAAAALVLWLA